MKNDSLLLNSFDVLFLLDFADFMWILKTSRTLEKKLYAFEMRMKWKSEKTHLERKNGWFCGKGAAKSKGQARVRGTEVAYPRLRHLPRFQTPRGKFGSENHRGCSPHRLASRDCGPNRHHCPAGLGRGVTRRTLLVPRKRGSSSKKTVWPWLHPLRRDCWRQRSALKAKKLHFDFNRAQESRTIQ